MYIEVDNVDWFSTWLKRHEFYLWDSLCKVNLVAKSDKKNVILLSILSPKVHLFLWWWEVFAPARGRFYGWRNMLILYFWKFRWKKVTLLGWISRAKSLLFKILYRLTLPFAQKIILRDQQSYDYLIESYHLNKTAILYHDFGYDVIVDDQILRQGLSTSTRGNVMSKTWLHCPYLVINTNPYVDMSMLTEKLTMLTQKYNDSQLVYFPCWLEDKQLFKDLTSLYVDIEVDRKSSSTWHRTVDKMLSQVDKKDVDIGVPSGQNLSNNRMMFEWTEHDIVEILALLSHANEWLGVRLHFIAMLSWLGVPFDYVVYQEKIEKFLAWSKTYKKLQ